MRKFRHKVIRHVPLWLMRRIDYFSYSIERFIFLASREIPASSKVLDAGSGESPFSGYFTGHRYVSIDTQRGDPGWDYSRLDIIGDLTSLPCRQGIFDAVICTQVLEHVKEPARVLKELCYVLKQGGVIYLSAPQGWGVHQAPHDYFRFTNFALRYLLEKVGFEVIFIKPSCGYFGYLANRLTVFPKVVFWQIKPLWLRIIFSPVELISYFVFVIILPVILNSIDFIDRERNYTLDYFVKARKL